MKEKILRKYKKFARPPESFYFVRHFIYRHPLKATWQALLEVTSLRQYVQIFGYNVGCLSRRCLLRLSLRV